MVATIFGILGSFVSGGVVESDLARSEGAAQLPLQTARDLLAGLGAQLTKAEVCLDISAGGALDALAHFERKLQEARQALPPQRAPDAGEPPILRGAIRSWCRCAGRRHAGEHAMNWQDVLLAMLPEHLLLVGIVLLGVSLAAGKRRPGTATATEPAATKGRVSS